MSPTKSHRSPARSIRARLLATFGTLAVSTLIGAGCGDSGASEVRGAEALAWLPTDTWLVATGDLGADRIDEAVETLDRLPIWALVESELPATTGAGLRRELLELVASEAAGSSDAPVDAKRLEAAFGDEIGIAVYGVEELDGDQPPLAAWIEVDDDEVAVEVAREVFSGRDRAREHDGLRYYENDEDDSAWLVRDGLLLTTTSATNLERLIDVQAGDQSLAGDDEGRAVMDAGIGEALVGAAIHTEALLAHAPALVRMADDDSAAAKRIAEDLGPLLASDAVAQVVPSWMAVSLTVDDVGLRVRGAWSNPHELATPSPGTREIAERMPAKTNFVQGMALSGTELARVQAAWAEVREAYDLDLEQQVDEACPSAQEASCTFATQLLLTLLEDESLADALSKSGDVASVSMSNDLALAGAIESLSQDGEFPTLEHQLYESAFSESLFENSWSPGDELRDAAAEAGVHVRTTAGDAPSLNVRIAPGSPLTSLLRTADQSYVASFGWIFGVDVHDLIGPEGATFSGQRVDDLVVYGFPADARSTAVPAMRGDAPQLGDDEDYRRVVDAADPPEQVGSWWYVQLADYITANASMSEADPQDLQMGLQVIRNNLDDVPGAVLWTARETHDDQEVGVFELAVPVFE